MESRSSTESGNFEGGGHVPACCNILSNDYLDSPAATTVHYSSTQRARRTSAFIAARGGNVASPTNEGGVGQTRKFGPRIGCHGNVS